MSVDSGTRRTAVYIDGYNLYYGRLRGGPHKWLDIVALFTQLLAARDQNESLVKVKFFTACALATFARHKEASVEAQDAYLRALRQCHGSRFEAIFGKHAYDRSGTQLPQFVAGQAYDRQCKARVWKLEEKQTDVNLALHMFIDAWQARMDRLILVSNDSDAEPALQAIRLHFPHIMIGLVTPRHPHLSGQPGGRRTSCALANAADWSLSHLSDEQLLRAQLPLLIPTRRKPIRKPAHW